MGWCEEKGGGIDDSGRRLAVGTKVRANRSRSKVPCMHTHWRQNSYATSSAVLEVTRVLHRASWASIPVKDELSRLGLGQT